jgi:hypothetical protein
MGTEELLARLRARYEDTENPLAVWRAVLVCLGEERPLPDWARQHLLAVATDLCRLAELDEEPGMIATRETLRGTRARRVTAVLDAMRLRPATRGRKADAFEAWAPTRAEALDGMVRLCRAHGMTRESAIDRAVERWKVSRRTVERALGTRKK